MSEDTKKVDQIEQEAKASELAEQDLDKIAGGAAPPSSSPPVTQRAVTYSGIKNVF